MTYEVYPFQSSFQIRLPTTRVRITSNILHNPTYNIKLLRDKCRDDSTNQRVVARRSAFRVSPASYLQQRCPRKQSAPLAG